MIRTFIIFCFLFFIILTTYWISNQPGQITMEWFGYQIGMPSWLFVFFFVFFTLALSFILALGNFIIHFPAKWRLKKKQKNQEKGLAILSQTILTIAAGDTTKANSLIKQSVHYLGTSPLTLLLSAQIAQLAGDEKEAQKYFLSMQQNDQTEFLGSRGLITQSLQHDDIHQALLLTKNAMQKNGQNPWLIKTYLNLNFRLQNWQNCLDILDQAKKIGVLTQIEAIRYRAVIYTEQLRLKLSSILNNSDQIKENLDLLQRILGWAPHLIFAVILKSWFLNQLSTPRQLLKYIEKNWGVTPHPILADLYIKNFDKNKSPILAAQKLASFNPNHYISFITIAKVAIQEKKWDIARTSLNQAQHTGPLTIELCHLMIKIEEQGFHDPVQVNHWLDKLSKAEPNYGWVCKSCNYENNSWQACCPRCHNFDTIDWRLASTLIIAMDKNNLSLNQINYQEPIVNIKNPHDPNNLKQSIEIDKNTIDINPSQQQLKEEQTSVDAARLVN
ncbi:MAG: hypothetical protein K1X44_00870 [Alphaproteobacteria bacterium]|nr:hypothetical protein [Alphaproteobacteria bacterium]